MSRILTHWEIIPRRPNSLAGGHGFEPRLTESESAVLPLNYPPPARSAGLVGLRHAADDAPLPTEGGDAGRPRPPDNPARPAATRVDSSIIAFARQCFAVPRRNPDTGLYGSEYQLSSVAWPVQHAVSLCAFLEAITGVAISSTI